jgi:hypothetical protein
MLTEIVAVLLMFYFCRILSPLSSLQVKESKHENK